MKKKKASLAAVEKLRAVAPAASGVPEVNSGSGVSPLSCSLEDQEAACASHKLGENVNGWKNPYAKDDPRSLLLEYQDSYLRDGARYKAWLASRQVGKDFSSEGEAVVDCYSRKTDWMVAAPSERQALDSLDQAKVWAEAFDLKINNYEEKREGATSETLLKSAEVTFSNGSRIRAVPGRPDTVRGRSSNLLLTEFDFFENPMATWRAVLPSITNPLRGGEKRVRLVSTPNGIGGAMHKILEKPPGKSGAGWSKHVTNIYQAVLMGLPVNVAELKEMFDDPDGWLQEFCCRFLDSTNVLLPYDIIALAESFEATESWSGFDGGHQNGGVFIGVDFGRTNDPPLTRPAARRLTVAWTLQRVGDILWTREVLVLDKVSSPDQQTILKDRIRAAARVCFDYTGPGIGLGDYLAREHGEWSPEKHKFGKMDLCTFTAGFKRLIFPRLRRCFESPVKLRVPVSTAIREDLHMMKQVISNGEYSYWSDRTKLGHSDRCTALALAVRAAGDGAAAWRGGVFAGVAGGRMRAKRERCC